MRTKLQPWQESLFKYLVECDEPPRVCQPFIRHSKSQSFRLTRQYLETFGEKTQDEKKDGIHKECYRMSDGSTYLLCSPHE